MKLPLGIPDSNRVLDPTMPAGSTGNFQPVPPPIGVPAVAQTTNVMTNFAWEYVWHCHLLGHEENDMMRPIASVLNGVLAGNQVTLNWTDATPWNGTGPLTTLGNPANEIGFRIERATLPAGTFAQIGTALANQTGFIDTGVLPATMYRYRVIAWNVAGTATSNELTVGVVPPAAPTSLVATVQSGPGVGLTWRDNATNETGFVIERSVNGGAFAPLVTVGPLNGTGNVSYTDTTVTAGTTYAYRVKAVNGGVSSSYSNTVTAIPSAVAAPSNVTATAARTGTTTDTVTLRWTDNANNETGFTIQRATNSTFTAGLTAYNVAANRTVFQNTGLGRNRTFFYRIRSVAAAGSSAWVNATPFPIITP